jgi:hypothetical protein
MAVFSLQKRAKGVGDRGKKKWERLISEGKEELRNVGIVSV